MLQVLLNISYGNNPPTVHLKQLNPYFEVATIVSVIVLVAILGLSRNGGMPSPEWQSLNMMIR